MLSQTVSVGEHDDSTFLREVESLSNALHIKHKKQSASTWKKWKKSIKAIAAYGKRRRRFRFRFHLHVHSMDGMTPSFEGTVVAVQWGLVDGDGTVSASTLPARVVAGVAKFEETLACCCSVTGYPSSSGFCAYEPTPFFITASVVGGAADGLVLGKHKVDLTRVLPINSEDGQAQGQGGLGRWSIRFRLESAGGQERGAWLRVSLGFSIKNDVGDDSVHVRNVSEDGKWKSWGSCSVVSGGKSQLLEDDSHGAVDDVKVLHEVLSKDFVSGNVETEMQNEKQMVLDQEAGIVCNLGRRGVSGLDDCRLLKPVEGNVFSIKSKPGSVLETEEETELDEIEFEVVDKGIEFTSEDQVYNVNWDNIKSEDKGEALGLMLDEVDAEISYNIQNHEDVDALLCSLSALDSAQMESRNILDDTPNIITQGDACSGTMTPSTNKSCSLDDVMDSVVNEFLSMLGIESCSSDLSSVSEDESQVKELLKLFEMETLQASQHILSVEKAEPHSCEWVDFDNDFDLDYETDSWIQNAMDVMAKRSMIKMFEEVESEEDSLHQWSSDEEFQCSSPMNRGGFGSPIDLPPAEPLELPYLGEVSCPIRKTKDGAFLFSMIVKNNKTLMMQVSHPIVVPAAMGSGIMNTLQYLVSLGIDKLSIRSNKLMFLEDISGKTMQQINEETVPVMDDDERHDKEELECVSLEDLVPLVMHEIEALSIEGLRIQSGMPDEDAPTYISPLPVLQSSPLREYASESSSAQAQEGTTLLQFLDIEESGDVDGLTGLCITLDEWMKLDSGDIGVDDRIDSQKSKILAAHRDDSAELNFGVEKVSHKATLTSGRRWGFLANNFTVALKVQFRDPSCKFEPVGMPMLSLIQVKRVFYSMKLKTYKVPQKWNSKQEYYPSSESSQSTEEESENEDVIPRFKISGIHVAGVNIKSEMRKLWDNPLQKQSGKRYLLDTEICKSSEYPVMKFMTSVKPSQVVETVPPDDHLWSISACFPGTKWLESEDFKPFIRNPNILFHG